jgi:G3E family GTPase
MRIFRLKGILQVQGESHLQVLQAVFDVFEVRASSYEKGDDGDATKGLNRVVVIGRNLDKAQIEQGFLKCVVVPS